MEYLFFYIKRCMFTYRYIYVLCVYFYTQHVQFKFNNSCHNNIIITIYFVVHQQYSVLYKILLYIWIFLKGVIIYRVIHIKLYYMHMHLIFTITFLYNIIICIRIHISYLVLSMCENFYFYNFHKYWINLTRRWY